MASQQIDGNSGSDADTLVPETQVSGGSGSVRSMRTAASPKSTSGSKRSCYLCQTSGVGLPHVIDGCNFCKRCEVAMRAKKRVLREDGKEAVNEDRIKMKRNPEQWRQDTSPWLDDRGAARLNTRKKISKSKVKRRGKRNENKSGQVEMTKQRYKKYVGWWDDAESLDAESEFERLLVEQNSDNGMVWIADLGRRREHISYSDSASQQEEFEDDDGDDGDDNAQATPRRGRQGRGRSREPHRDRQRGRSHSRSRRRGEGQSRSTAQGSAGPGAPTQAEPKAPNARAGGGKPRKPQAPSEPNEAVSFLSSRENLKQRLVSAVKGLTELKKTLAVGLKDQAKRKVSREVDSSDLPHDNEALNGQCDSFIEKYTKWQDRAKKVKQTDISVFEEEVTQADNKVPELEGKIRKQLETLKFAGKTLSNEYRKVYQHRRWRVQKVIQHCVAAQFDPGLAKLVATALNRMWEAQAELADDTEVKVDPQCKELIAVNKEWSEIDKNKPAVWTSGDKLPFPDAFLADAVPKLNEKAQCMNAEIVENKTWGGAQGQILGTGIPEEFGAVGTVPAFAEPGGQPWMVACRPYAKRRGPRNFPLPGYPAMLRSRDDSLVIVCSPMSPLLERGITIQTMEAYWNSSEGQKLFTDRSCVFRLKAGETCFLPSGWWPCMTAASLDLSAKAGPSASQTCFPSAVCIALLQKTLWADASKEAMAAFKSWNDKHMTSKSSSEMWAQRKTTFDAHV